MIKFLIGLFLALFLLSCNGDMGSNVDQSDDPIVYAMDNSAKLILENPDIHSISIGVYHDGKTYTSYYGEVDRGEGVQANDNSIFEIASVTKTFTAYLTARAVLNGKLKLDDDIRMYLDKPYDNLVFDDRPILIRDILTHTSGIKRENFSQVLSGLFSLDITKEEKQAISEYNEMELLSDLADYQLDMRPGEDYDYSGFVAPEVLAVILQKVYEQPYPELLDELILNKADMNHTSLVLTEHQRSHLLNGYTNDNRLVAPLQMPLTGAGGGLKSTVPDMLKYIEFLLKDEEQVLKEMRTPLFYDEIEGDEYGYFWMIDGDDLMLLNGGTGGSVNWLILLPTMNTGFTLSFNYNGDGANDLINSMASYLIGDLVNYPIKNAFYPIMSFINKYPDTWQEKYTKLKNENKEGFNFDDLSLLDDIGFELIDQGRSDLAVEAFQLLVAEFPDTAKAHERLGKVYFFTEKYELALESYKKSIELDADNEDVVEIIKEIEDILKEE